MNKTIAIVPTTSRNWTGDSWILFNRANVGYYRVNYNKEMWFEIIADLHSNNRSESKAKIATSQRAQLIDDSIDFSFSGRLPFEMSLNLLQYITNEDDYRGWEAAINALNRLNNAIIGTEYCGRFLTFVRSLLKDKYDFYGLKVKSIDEPDIVSYTRRNIISLACKVQLSKCLTDTQNDLVQYLKGDFETTSFLRAVIIRNGLRTCDRSQFLDMLRLLEHVKGFLRQDVVAGIGATHDESFRNILFRGILANNGDFIENIEINLSEEERVDLLLGIINSNEEGYVAVLKFMTNESTIKTFPKL